MKITIVYELGDSWNSQENLPVEIIHETMLEQIEKHGFVQDVNNLTINKA